MLRSYFCLVNKKADSDTILSKKKRFAHRPFIVFLKIHLK